jgi:hypothetical protein
VPECPICKRRFVKSGWLRKHLLKLNKHDYSVSGNSIAKRTTIMSFLKKKGENNEIEN